MACGFAHPLKRQIEATRNDVGQRRGRRAPEDDQIVSESQQSSCKRRRIGLARKSDHALAPRLVRDPLKRSHQPAQIVLETRDFGGVETSREPQQQLRDGGRHLSENSGRRLQSQSVRAFREHQHGDDDRDGAAEGDLRHARDRRRDRAHAKLASDQEHDHGGEGRHSKARTDRRRQRQRGERKRQNESLRSRGRMGNEHAERGGVNSPAESPDHVFDRRPERSADAHLDDHHGGQHRPQSVQWKGETLDDGQSQEAGDRHAHTEAQLRP